MSGPAPGGGQGGGGSGRGRARANRVYLGWQYALLRPDPGPAPRRPVPPEAEQVSPDWVAAQRREEGLLDRPYLIAIGAAGLLLGGALALWRAGAVSLPLAAVVAAAALFAAGRCGQVIRSGRRDLRARLAAEQHRVTVIKETQQRRLTARQESHARMFRDWQARRAAFDSQRQWYAVPLPGGIDRVDVAGGTLAGWSALLTMIAAPRLDAGGEVTVVDLTEGGVAGDLLAAAARSGVAPQVWVLPGDLPRLALGTGLGREATAELLAVTASEDGPGGGGAAGTVDGGGAGAGGRGRGDPVSDSAILDRVLGVLPDGARISAVTAALRALAQIGDPRADLRAGLLTAAELDQVAGLYGRGAADRVVLERAWALESRLRLLDELAAEPSPQPDSRLRVAWLDQRAGELRNQVTGRYLVAALTQLLRRAPAGRPWAHTLCVLGAERLPPALIDGLTAAAERPGTGLVLAYRTIPGPVRQRLGRGNAAVAFMRLGNADDAKAASEQIGTEHRFVISQLTDTVGLTVTDTAGDSYTSTVGGSVSAGDSLSVSETSGRSRSSGRSRDRLAGPFGPVSETSGRDTSESGGTSVSRSVTSGISDSTAWGRSTSRAMGGSVSQARSRQRSREFLVEAHELQQLPPSAVLVSYAAAEGRQLVLADANPALIALPTATLASLDEARREAMPGGPPPNLGPPPQRLDWRTYRR
jgi:hypothetical protein